MTRQLTHSCLPAALVLSLLCCMTALAQSASPDVTQQALEHANNTDPQAWRLLAVEAREAGNLEIAETALNRAAELGLPPVSVGLERARQAMVRGDRAAATAILQQLVDGGFRGIAAISSDPVLAGLKGTADFDALMTTLEQMAYPCAYQERFREFDFWLGQWDVHLANGTFAGTNTIEASERGCVLIEKWRSATAGTGQSINYLDGVTGEWVQVWNDAAGTQIAIRGGMSEAGMLLTGQIHYLGNSTTLPFRGLWTPLPDGRVRQFFEQSNDAGTTWTPWFEGFYSPRNSD